MFGIPWTAPGTPLTNLPELLCKFLKRSTNSININVMSPTLVDSVACGRFRLASTLDMLHAMIHVMRLLFAVLVVKSAGVVSAALCPNNGPFVFKASEIICDR